MPRDFKYLQYMGAGWAAMVGTSVAYSLTVHKHLLFSQRMIHARLYAQVATIGALGLTGVMEANAAYVQSTMDRLAPPSEPPAAGSLMQEDRTEQWEQLLSPQGSPRQ